MTHVSMIGHGDYKGSKWRLVLSACACGSGQAGRDETFFNGIEAAIMTFGKVM